MAEIYGITITGLKTFVGMEGQAFQGNVKMGRKKLGFWSQDANGGICDMYDFDKNLLKDAAKKYFDTFPSDWEYRYLYEKPDGTMDDSFIDIMLNDLAEMIMDEKEWKKNMKKGYPVMVYYHKKPSPETPLAIPVPMLIFVHGRYLSKDDEDILGLIKRTKKADDLEIEKIYRQAEDFRIA